MTDERQTGGPDHRLLAAGIAGAALLAVHAALWFYFRARQPDTDARTRERLRPGADR